MTDLARLRRLRGQLAAEHAKAVRADQHPRPDLDHLRVTPHNGMAAGLEIAIFFADRHLREAGEEARTTPDNPATSSDTADNPLRQQYAAALSTLTVLGGAPPARLVPVVRWGAGEVTRIVDWRPLDTLLDALLAVRDRELERLQAQLDEAQQNALALDQGREELFARIAQVRALHQPDPDGRTGYQPDADDTPGAYGDIAQACRECGSSDLAVRWPCPTILALDPPAPQEPGEQP
jgi:hypothetical protein